ncbi:Cytochrome c oxidase subunit 4 [Tilletia horrida]|nr:Cytochrome c oxidase subunit 4 [Tilletia horrida]KAK0559168.1 Cytochrome c oxidase subunit 4 [Tilletia horrida]
MIARQLASLALRAPAARAAFPRTASFAPAPAMSSVRALSSSAAWRAAGPPVITGEGSADGEVPTDESQATGLERFELLGRLDGVDVFDLKPLDASRVGTLKDPIKVKSLFTERIIGCTGSPAGSHDTIWLHLNTELEHHRCPECGSVYKLDFIGDADQDHHH